MSEDQKPLRKPAQRNPLRANWPNKFRVAVRGALLAIRAQVNFKIHLALAIAVVAAGAWLGVSLIEWCVLALCLATVLSAECFNTSLEHLARAITREHNEEIRDALDVAAGAVLIAAIGAALVGAAIFVNRLAQWPGW
jgi:diacylglycerol kinase